MVQARVHVLTSQCMVQARIHVLTLSLLVAESVYGAR